jgi:DNA (cytosine-5)-methyltransferase 1
MKRDLFTLPLGLADELIIDNFAGGGGTSTGLEAAFGRPVDIAINHDQEALAMHAINHPHTRHLCESVWEVDPIKVTNNQPVGLVWLSPDCKHFSKAKGGKPVEKKIRGLAWVALRWAAMCKPRVIMLENVEEFKTWGPLMIDVDGNAKPDPSKKGKTFESFVRQLRGHGYDVAYREFRACDHNTPTIRKRFFLVARRDGLPIMWPAATHGAPDSIGVRAGKLLPYRTAAECIDFNIPCPSIFDRKKPLAEATLRRIAKGIMRYVVNASDPFIIGQGGPIHRSVVVPSIVPVTHHGGDRIEPIDEPFRTITGAHRGEKALSTAFLRPYYSDKRPTDARGQMPDEPINTIVTENRHAVVSAFLAKHYTGVVGSDLQEPLGTATSVDHHSVVMAHVTKFRKGAIGSPIDEPLHTVTAGGGGKSALLLAHLESLYGQKGNETRAPDLREPAKTITASVRHALMTSNLVKLRGTSSTASMEDPLHTVSAGGQHHAEVRAFLLSYYGTYQNPNTVTSHDRFGLVTIQGQDYQIVDIGLRMLSPPELYRAQGFPTDYIIHEIPDPSLLFLNGNQTTQDPLSLPRVPLTKSSQVRMCGNSVCPPLSEALIRANFMHEREIARVA